MRRPHDAPPDGAGTREAGLRLDTFSGGCYLYQALFTQ
jgi:hypothetical protein